MMCTLGCIINIRYYKYIHEAVHNESFLGGSQGTAVAGFVQIEVAPSIPRFWSLA